VYLVKEDFSGIYLSLNQGVTTVKEQYAPMQEGLCVLEPAIISLA